MTRILRTLCLGLFVIASGAQASGTLEAREAWVREAPPSVNVLAAYLQLLNHGGEDRILTRVTSPAFAHVEIHRTEEHDGMTHMIQLTEITIPANGSVVFEPGSLHLMLIDPKAPLKAGDNVPLTLYFAGSSTLKVTLPVRKGDDAMEGHHDMHDHQHMH